jgi:hypothetical protein
MRKLLVLLGLGGLVAAGVKVWKGRQDKPIWHTPDTDG